MLGTPTCAAFGRGGRGDGGVQMITNHPRFTEIIKKRGNVWILSISLVLTDYLQFVHNGEAAKVGVELPHSFHLLLLIHLNVTSLTEIQQKPITCVILAKAFLLVPERSG